MPKEKPAAAVPTDLLTAQEVANLLGLAKGTIRNWTAQGKIPYYQIGHLVRYSRAEMATLVSRVEAIA